MSPTTDIKDSMTNKQLLFIKEYLIDLNATQAAIRAGYSKNTAGKIGQENLIKPEINSAIQKALKERNKRVDIDADYVLNRLVEIDEMDVLDILSDSGGLRPISEWPKSWRTTISGFDVMSITGGDTISVLKKIKWPDKLRNIELLGRHINIKAWDKEKGDYGTSIADALSDIADKLPS